MQGSVYSSDSVHVGFQPVVQAPSMWGSSHAAGSAHDARLSRRKGSIPRSTWAQLRWRLASLPSQASL